MQTIIASDSACNLKSCRSLNIQGRQGSTYSMACSLASNRMTLALSCSRFDLDCHQCGCPQMMRGACHGAQSHRSFIPCLCCYHFFSPMSYVATMSFIDHPVVSNGILRMPICGQMTSIAARGLWSEVLASKLVCGCTCGFTVASSETAVLTRADEGTRTTYYHNYLSQRSIRKEPHSILSQANLSQMMAAVLHTSSPT